MNTCVLNTLLVSKKRNQRASQVPTHISASSPTSPTPVVDLSWIDQFYLKRSIACYLVDGIGFHN